MSRSRAEGGPVRPGGDRAPSPQRVGNERRLTALYLLTVADIRGTSPKVWNAWKGKLLEDLYRLTLRALGGARARPRRRDRGAQARGAGARWRCMPLPFEAHKALWEHARGRLLRAPRRRRHRLAHALAVAPRRHGQAGRARAPVAGRRRPAGAGLRARPAGPVRAHLRLLRPAPASTSSTPRCTPRSNGYALDTFQVVSHLHPASTTAT